MKWFAEQAWLPTGLTRDVLLEAEEGRFTNITAATTAPPDAQRLPGLVLPGFANAHSHAFHRALRGRTHDDRGSFWSWRERMYAVAGKLNPDQYLRLATAAYAEMAMAGVSAVGEFHYLHFQPGGRPYDDANEMGAVLMAAAAAAGIRLTLLDTCYLAGGLTADGHLPLDQVQRRFADPDARFWQRRVLALEADDNTVIGSAIHSVRAVPRDQLSAVAELPGPLHIHVSEQPAENKACEGFYGLTPVQLLDAEGALSNRTTAVHATHLKSPDIATLGRTGTGACFCPSTERDLADGIGPALLLLQAGSPLSLGSDQHVVTDLLGEAQALEMNERLSSHRRGRFSAQQLVEAMTCHGHRAIGRPDGGLLAVGAPADLVAVRTDSVRTAGAAAAQVIYAASAADVATVIVGGRTVVSDGHHLLGDVGALLAAAIDPLWGEI